MNIKEYQSNRFELRGIIIHNVFIKDRPLDSGDATILTLRVSVGYIEVVVEVLIRAATSQFTQLLSRDWVDPVQT